MSRQEPLSAGEAEAVRSEVTAGNPAACVVCGKAVSGARCEACGAVARAGHYAVRRLIAQTAHSRVYLARGPDGQDVALKELLFSKVPSTQELEAFEREARLLQTLSHPRLPRLWGHFQEGEGAGLRLYLAAEYLSGETLLERLAHHTFTEDEARDIARQVLDILVYLHGRQPRVLHRDLKPANLIRQPDGTVCLVDFGAARESAKGATTGSTLVGTFGYMPLEQFGGTVDVTSDLYALGATLIHLLGRTPPADHFQPDRGLDVSHLKAPLLGPWLRKLTALRPEDRYPSATAARQALEALKPGSPAATSVQEPSEAISPDAPAALARLQREAQSARSETDKAHGRWNNEAAGKAREQQQEKDREKDRHEDDRLSFMDFYRMGSHWATTPLALPVLSLITGIFIYRIVSTFNLMELPSLETRAGLLLVLALVLATFVVVGGPLFIRAWLWRSAFRKLPFALEGLGQVVHRADGEWTRFTRCTLRVLFRKPDSPPGAAALVKTAHATALQLAVDRANESLSRIARNPDTFQKLRWSILEDRAEGYANWRTCGQILKVCSESLAPVQQELGLIQAVVLEPSEQQFKISNKRGR
ncbi:serine/threonine protein kinase [Hyalangium minutum]|uniref:non-specific serine/threonine protein kinase n=1 Tax=Hyalangium minutum TaxID=394096 RepID=A0A085WRZ7_9BACT|nr:serine/threonine-protein kinase [Hyalangium minutum]KFE70460.1 serine/threonine protein kinase [Hyalangium minutum]